MMNLTNTARTDHGTKGDEPWFTPSFSQEPGTSLLVKRIWAYHDHPIGNPIGTCHWVLAGIAGENCFSDSETNAVARSIEALATLLGLQRPILRFGELGQLTIDEYAAEEFDPDSWIHPDSSASFGLDNPKEGQSIPPSVFTQFTRTRTPRSVVLPSGGFSPQIIGVDSGWVLDQSPLDDALLDLDQVVEEAREKDFEIPSQLVLDNSRRLLRDLFRISPRRFEVYPMPEGEVAIDGSGESGRWVILSCGPDGEALCLVGIDGRREHQCYLDAGTLPDEFVRHALDALDNVHRHDLS